VLKDHVPYECEYRSTYQTPIPAAWNITCPDESHAMFSNLNQSTSPIRGSISNLKICHVRLSGGEYWYSLRWRQRFTSSRRINYWDETHEESCPGFVGRIIQLLLQLANSNKDLALAVIKVYMTQYWWAWGYEPIFAGDLIKVYARTYSLFAFRYCKSVKPALVIQVLFRIFRLHRYKNGRTDSGYLLQKIPWFSLITCFTGQTA